MRTSGLLSFRCDPANYLVYIGDTSAAGQIMCQSLLQVSGNLVHPLLLYYKEVGAR